MARSQTRRIAAQQLDGNVQGRSGVDPRCRRLGDDELTVLVNVGTEPAEWPTDLAGTVLLRTSTEVGHQVASDEALLIEH